jgi:hypothetical protein
MIHKNYLLLNAEEKKLADELLHEAINQSDEAIGYRLRGDDTAERAAEALATWFVSSRANQEDK